MMRLHWSGVLLAGAGLVTSASAQGQEENVRASRLAQIARVIAEFALEAVDTFRLRTVAMDAIRDASQRDATGWTECAGAGAGSSNDLSAATFQRALACVEPVGRDAASDAGAAAMATLVDHGAWFAPAKTPRKVAPIGGVGLTVRRDGGSTVVLLVSADSPAQAAGIVAGDELVAVDGLPTSKMTFDAVIAGLRGAEGSVVGLSIRRGDSPPRELQLRRQIIRAARTTAARRSAALVIALSELRPNTATAVETLIRDGKADASVIVLDLRGNNGGLLSEAVAIADLFLIKGTIVTLQGRSVNDVEINRARNGDVARDFPIAVLVDAQTAAGAEIIAAALQDHRRAVVLGTKTFGAGTVQTLVPIDAGGFLRLTTSRLIRADGRPLADSPVTPDCLWTGDSAAEVDLAITIAASGAAACDADRPR